MTDIAVNEDQDAQGTEVVPGAVVLDGLDEQLIDQLVGQARAKGVKLAGQGGLPAALTKRLLESALDGEITDHLGYDRHDPAACIEPDSQYGSRSGGKPRRALRTGCIGASGGEYCPERTCRHCCYTARTALSMCCGIEIAGKLKKRKHGAMENPKRDKP